jgi:protein-tyrosine-phosphatase
MAEGLFRKMVTDEDGQWKIKSAGIATGGGQPPSEHTISILNAKNIDLSGNRSQVINADLINSADHIIAMSSSHLYTLEALFPQAAEKTFLVTEFCVRDAIRGQDIPDPIGGGLAAYTEVRDMLLETLPSIMQFILKTPSEKDQA